MTKNPASSRLEALLDSWKRNNTVMLNLLRALPEGALAARAAADSPTVAQQVTHLCHERLVSVYGEAPEFARPIPAEEWSDERDKGRIAELLTENAEVVRDAVRGRILAGRDLDLNYGHPALMLQLLLWHEGYHHGQIKLVLEIWGHPIPNEQAGPLTWDVWRKGRGESV